MLALLSPAKTLNEDQSVQQGLEAPKFRKQSGELISILKDYSPAQIKDLMHISDKLAELNSDRYHAYSARYNAKNSKAAIYMFKGDVYQGFDADSLEVPDIAYAQDHVRILSGLYGLLRPMDKMQAYRLEMGTRLKTPKGNNLYDFWKETLTKEINRTLKEINSDLIVNLASVEYFSALNKKELKAEIHDVTFKEYRDDKLKFISFSAKKARGYMARYICKNKIENKEDLKGFDYEGYSFMEDGSTEGNYLFVR